VKNNSECAIGTQQQYAIDVAKTMAGLKFFLTSKGAMSIGPFTLEEEDRIAVLSQLHLPVLLRLKVYPPQEKWPREN
jgi:hypothetical protein